jgi:subtilisin family serine protease
LLLGLILFAAFLWTQPSYATSNDERESRREKPSQQNLAASEDESTQNARAYGSYLIQLEAEPAAAFYASLLESTLEGEQAQVASVNAATAAQLADIEQAQMQLMDTLATFDAQMLYRLQRVLNGIAVYAPTDQVAALAAQPGVQGLYPLIPKEPDNARTAQLLGLPAVWQGNSVSGLPGDLTGEGISIAIIDTGVDYLHTHFGGPGTGYSLNNPTIIGDVPNFPGAKVVGGHDFAGDNYDASPQSSNFQPVPEPDPDPMDCYSFGHGTHVAGTAAGYGVNTNGTTYTGTYSSTLAPPSFRIGPGMAPSASIYALKVFGCSGSSNIVDLAVEWAVDPNQDGDFSDRVDVINLSLGSSFGAIFDPTAIAVENAAKLGIIVVTSAGNTGDVHYAMGSPGVATRAIAVAATSVNSSDPANYTDGTIAAFSARGPRRSDNLLKPDIAAPGVTIFSAQLESGSQGVSSSGTSMASPVVAGIMALLRQAHPESGTPGWRNYELKALAMNTAVHPFFRPDDVMPYSLLRVGAGRIDPAAALQSQLIAFDAAVPEQVSINFGEVDVLDGTSAVRSIRLANKGTTPISITVGYTSVRELPGVMIDVGAGKVITVPARGFVTTSVTLTANAAQMARVPDPTRQITPPDDQPWVDEASGYVTFTPVITASGPMIHLPILALPRTISAMNSQGATIDLGSNLTATYVLTVTGSAVTNAVAPTKTVPLIGVFGLAHNSPPITEVPTEDPALERYAQADLRYVGTAGPFLVNGEPTLYFALVSYGAWSTPLEVTYQIIIDVNNNNIADYRLQNKESTDVSGVDLISTDDFVSLLEPVRATRTIQGALNIFPSTEFDTRPFGNNVMILPLKVRALGVGVTGFRYQVISLSRDILDGTNTDFIEQTPILTILLDQGAGVTTDHIATDQGVPLLPVATGDQISVTFDHAAYLAQDLEGLLLLYLHNDLSTRSQVLPVQREYLNHSFLPSIRDE